MRQNYFPLALRGVLSLFDMVDREATARSLSARSIIAMPALVAGIHVLIFYEQQKTWMAGRQGAYALFDGLCPAMTKWDERQLKLAADEHPRPYSASPSVGGAATRISWKRRSIMA